MSIELIKISLSYYTLPSVLSLVTLTAVVSVVVMIIRRRRKEPLHSLATFIDSIPFFAGLIPLTGFLTLTYHISRAISSTANSGLGDPRVVAAGLQEIFFFLTVWGGLFFIFLETWLVMRIIYGSFIRELDMPKK